MANVLSTKGVPRKKGTPFFLCLLLLFPVFCGDMSLNGADIAVREYTIRLPGWQKQLRELRVALISDLHLTDENCKDLPFRELAGMLNAMDPDLILIAGDVFHGVPTDHNIDYEDVLSQVFSAVKIPPLGMYAVAGNHDDLIHRSQFRKVLKKNGIRTMAPGMVHLPFHGGTLHLGMLEDTYEHAYDLPRKLKQDLRQNAPCILLTHYPTNFHAVPDDLPVLVLAGHTHGGLIRIPVPGVNLAQLFAPKHDSEFIYGFYSFGKKQMIVTSGLGGQGSSALRVNNPPEIVLLHFKAPADSP